MVSDEKQRCDWGTGGGELLQRYHDEEWGVPVHDDRTHFEFLVLEMFQAGLSWLTVLRKRDAFMRAFAKFDPKKVAAFNSDNIARLLNNTGIIRNRLKIEASINNAARFLDIQQESGSFDRYIWGFVGGKPVVNSWKSISEIPPRTELSDRISADLKQRGFKFVGSTIIYAHLQATGLVNDHVAGCFRWKEVSLKASSTKS